MNITRRINNDTYWVGVNDRRISLFENIFPLKNGVSYNSYLLIDDKNVLFDTVEWSSGRQLLENIKFLLKNKSLDYIVINHMEPDHCAMLMQLIKLYPDVTFVGNAKTFQIINQFFADLPEISTLCIKEGDSLCTGTHTLNFYMAPMVHWPESMVTYDSYDKTLYSADAFGTFGALPGNIFNDEINFDKDWLDDARRYYANIVGKYGTQVQALLKKASLLEIKTICPLHGPVLRENISYFVEKYNTWSNYIPEDKGIMIAYASMYGNTENAANALAVMLADRGVKNIAVYDISKTHLSELVSESFRCSHIVLASPTYNNGIYPPTEAYLHDILSLNLQNRTFAVIENGTWAPSAAKQEIGILEKMKNITILNNVVTIKSSLSDNGVLCSLADEITASIE